MKFEKITIAKRLGIGYGILILILAIITGLGMNGLREANKSLHHLADINVRKIELLNDMSESVYISARTMRTIALIHDEQEASKQRVKIDDAQKLYNASFDALQQMPLDVAGKAFVEKIKLDATAAQGVNNKFIELAKTDQDAAVKLLLSDSIPLNANWQAALHDFSELQKTKNHRDEESAEQDYDSAITFMAVFALLSIMLGVFFASFISRSILRQLGAEPDETVAIANSIAAGDLTVHIHVAPDDESSLLYAIKAMRDSLETIVGQVRNGTETISVASREISSGNLDLSSRTEHQASSL